VERLLEQLVERDETARQEMEKLRKEVVDARIQAAEFETERRIRGEMTVTDGQLSALQARLEALHVANLLSDDELFSLEDLCADFAELQATAGVVTKELLLAVSSAATLQKLVGVSERMASDKAFARQARRKFVPQ
jgi:hypothetical protein